MSNPCFLTVIVGVDGAAGGRDAHDLVRQLAPDAAHLILASVDLSDPLGPRMAGGAIRADAERQAAAFSEEARAAGPEVVVRVASAGSVADGLAEEARRCGADLIVVGSSQRGRGMRVLLGDDTRDILHQAPCSVAVAPKGFAERSSSAITALGVGYGTDAASERAIEVAQQLKPPDGSLRLTQVTRPSLFAVNPLIAVVLDSARTANASERLATLEGFDTRNVHYGSVRDGLLELAHRVDLLVIGLHRRSAIGRLLRASTADALLRELPCPLLAVPELPLHAPIAGRAASPR